MPGAGVVASMAKFVHQAATTGQYYWTVVDTNNLVIARSPGEYPNLLSSKDSAHKAKVASGAATTDPRQKTAAGRPFYEVYAENDTNRIQKWWFRLVAGDKSTKLAKSQGYATEAGAKKGMENAQREITSATE